MAIDSAEKRRSAASAGIPWLIPGVTPNASKDAEWRQQSGWSYSGIPAAVPAIPIILVLAGAFRTEHNLTASLQAGLVLTALTKGGG